MKPHDTTDFSPDLAGAVRALASAVSALTNELGDERRRREIEAEERDWCAALERLNGVEMALVEDRRARERIAEEEALRANERAHDMRRLTNALYDAGRE